ncbi:hypothetical protein [Arthrobacter sp. H41]|uniref:hypothetical protein n=1 Tax=Arthrobacter sp. H41 TaxID=1312978 RepID=UPI0004BC86A0|nr:hypothetical protein [Arthrobacter sp. H41]
MLFPLTLAAATAPSDEPALREGLDPASVTPGTLGFLATLFVVIGVFFLIRDMTKRIRRVRYTAMVEDARLQDAADTGGAADSGNDGGPSARRLPDHPGGPDQGTPPISEAQQQGARPIPGGRHGPDAR